MALDYGRRRIGIAATDPTRTIASPRGFVERPDRRAGPEKIPTTLLAAIAELEPSRIVVGIPFAMDGSEGAMAREVRAFTAALGEATGVETVEWDERLTTARAERELRALDLRRSRRREKGRTDEMAAALLLSAYLRSRPAG